MSDVNDQNPELKIPKIAKSKEILESLAEALDALGLAGDKTNALLIYLAFISCLLTETLSIALVGPSGSGKSFVIKILKMLFPTDWFVEVNSATNAALYNQPESLKNKILIITEKWAWF